MIDQVISKDAIRRKGAEARRRGQARDSHGFNWHAPAIEAWEEGYDEAQQYHGAPVQAGRVDVGQTA